MRRPIRDFTQGELDWQPWITPLDLDHANEAQRDALKITPSGRAIGAYALVLAHDPESVRERSPLYNGIMFGQKGLPRADRELGAVVASRINGCAYCASVHAKRFNELAKEPAVMQTLWREGRRGQAGRCPPRRDHRLCSQAHQHACRDDAERCRAAEGSGADRHGDPRSYPGRRHVRLGQPADAIPGRASLVQTQTVYSGLRPLSTSRPVSVMTMVWPSDMARLFGASIRIACRKSTMPGTAGIGLPE